MKDALDSAFPFRWWQFSWYLFLLIFGVTGNLIVILVIIFNKKIEAFSTFNIMVFVLAATDLLVSLVGLPIYILSTDAFDHPAGRHGDYLCMFFTGYFIPFFLLDISVFVLVAIALGRRRAIVKPFSVLEGESKFKKVFKIFSSILLALGLGFPTIFGLEYTPSNPMVGNHCTYKYTFIQSIVIYCAVFVIDTLVPIAVLVTCFAQIKRSFRKTNALLLESVGNKGIARNGKSSELLLTRKKKTIVTMKYVVIAFFLCILPNHVFYLLSLAGVKGLGWNTVICQVGVLIRFSNSCINPFLYSFKSQNFRKNLKTTFTMFRRRKRREINSGENGSRRSDGYVIVNQNTTSSLASDVL